MIEAVYKIGSIVEEKDFLEEYIDDIGKGYKHVFKIKIDISEKEFKYEGIDYEEFDKGKKMKYFYKKGPSNGTDKTPTSRITQIEKTFIKKILPIFSKILENNKKILEEKEKNFLMKLNNLIQKNKDEILKDLLKYTEEKDFLKKDGSITDGGIITVIFKKYDKYLYIGDLDVFINLFKNNEKEAYKNYYYSDSNKVYSKEKDKLCYICNKKVDEVWGFVNTYNFYNVDKESYISGGFKRENAWKNYPVCYDCAKTLKRGKDYIDNNLKFKFCKFDYYLIPELVIYEKNLLKDIIKKLKKYRDFSLQENKASLIENVEEAILRKLSEENNQVNFNFIFFKKQNSAFKILLYLQEISPTRLKYLINSKDKVDSINRKYAIFNDLRSKKGNISLNFSFQFIRDFFPNNKQDGNFDKYFLSILNDIFIDKKININFLISRFMEKISREYLNDNWVEIWVLKAYKILIYLEKIKILERKRGVIKMDVYEEDNVYEEFFKENNLLDDDVKKALFLEGVLVQKLLNIQYNERNSTPFRSRLNGLKIDEKVVKRIFTETINKLEEYNKNYYKKLEEIIGRYMLNADFKKYSVDEMSFYFTLGMTLEKHFKPEDLNKDKEE